MANKNKIVDSTREKEEENHHPFNRLRFFLITLLLIGLFLRLLFLGHASYQIDEINVIRDAVSQGSVADIIRTELKRFIWYHCLPFLIVIVRVFTKALGFSGLFPPEWVARLPFALLGVASLPLCYLLGISVRDRKVGLWTMFLVTFSVFHVFYSREAYSYGLLMFFAIGTLWTGIQLVQHAPDDTRRRWAFAFGYMLFSSGLLQSHLSALLFLAPWNLVMAAALIRRVGWRALLRVPRLCFLALTFGMAYLVFSPFLLKLSDGYVTTDFAGAAHFSWSVIPALLGRMGWGQSPWSLLPFALFVVTGFFDALTSLREKRDSWGILIALQLVLYFVLQSWMLNKTQSRFEVRYYCALFPLLIVLAAMGIERVVSWISSLRSQACFGGVGGSRDRRIPLMAARVILIVILLGWLFPSLWFVVNLECRGNYKMVARWINDNIPVNGIYAYCNIYELRGVPSVYPTPQRYAAFPGVWNSADDYARLQIGDRLISFFRRFPLAAYIEPCPVDLLGPPSDECYAVMKAFPRDLLFARQTWLGDKYFQCLVKLGTYPPGEAQWSNGLLDRVLISYNKPEDLPVMARKRGEKFYHYFGQSWKYTKDSQYNDWRYIEDKGVVVAGNATEMDRKVVLKMKLLSQPAGCQLSVIGPDGSSLARNVQVKPEVQELAIPDVVLKPGDNSLLLKLAPLRGAPASALFVYSFDVTVPAEQVD